ncbi:MAG: hypothetical protein JSU74_09805 [Candidatus Zixiibacteriota bacterium]|nr:MAG: hypothetical protein JSU74_09805 [candidate division Zixibacteria bacterium]
MSKKVLIGAICSYFAILFFCNPAAGRVIPEFAGEKDPTLSSLTLTPAYGSVGHRIGQMVLCLNNNGTFGTGFSNSTADFFTGEPVPSCEFPKESNTRYLYAAAFWIGAVVGRDTLVSCAATGWSWGREFAPDQIGIGDIVKRSMGSIDPTLAAEAVSEEDYIMVYMDTMTSGVEPDYYGRPHIPLNIEVTQNSYAWSYSYAEDFVLFDYIVRNIGSNHLENVYMGIYVDADVYWGQSSAGGGYRDDICGFVEALPHESDGCLFWDTVNIAWIADNDGDPDGGVYGEQSVTGVTGTRIIRTPGDFLDVSFNWWISNSSAALDFGPRERSFLGRLDDEFRDFGTGGLGTPMGDANSYYQMRNMEFDYDQVYTATIGATDPVWLQPLQELAGDFANGFDTRYLLSFGPFDIYPGERLPISFAYVAGADFHVDPNNINNLPNNPDLYYDNVDFSDLGLNAAWAGRIYDNPGVDTDDDGDFGKVRFCCSDSTAYSLDSLGDTINIEGFDSEDCELIWYEGDGVPDFRGASPPPAPEFWLEPRVGEIRVRINGQRAETAKDVFSRRIDFEGYRVYVGRDERESSFSVVGSYDREDYNKFVWDGSDFTLFDIPYTLDSLRCLYGTSCQDSLFDPLVYSRDNPYRHPLFADSVFYFTAQDFNVAQFGSLTPIRKIYPEQPYPSALNPDSARADELTEDGRLKYFEYEIIIEGLLPTVPYYINVTAFDFGSPEADLEALESAVTRGAQIAYADKTAGDVMSGGLQVYVYPNPYRADADYRDRGFEGRMDADRPDDRVRTIHFANLPSRCTITVYSLDGDLVRQIEHDADPNDPTSSHETWNLITRNTQMVVSGLYYWVVEAEDGQTQIGKLVIIM